MIDNERRDPIYNPNSDTVTTANDTTIIDNQSDSGTNRYNLRPRAIFAYKSPITPKKKRVEDQGPREQTKQPDSQLDITSITEDYSDALEDINTTQDSSTENIAALTSAIRQLNIGPLAKSLIDIGLNTLY